MKALRPTRPTLLADTAISLIARNGLRGLTHRAVDAEAGVPEGSTSYYFRTRQALLSAALSRLAELDQAKLLSQPGADAAATTSHPGEMDQAASAADGRLSLEELAGVIANLVADMLTAGRQQVLARIELALEAARRPDLGEVLDTVRQAFLDTAASLLAAAGSEDPARHGEQLVAYLDGLLFAHLTIGRDRPVDPDALRLAVQDLLRGMISLRAGEAAASCGPGVKKHPARP